MSFVDRLREWFGDVVCHDHDDHATVTVKEKDTLSGIAEKRVGDADRWPELVAANPDRTFDEHYTIYPGEKLKIPKSWEPDLI